MIKQIIALAIAASFGVAHAADVKPVAEVKPAAAPAAAVVKAEAPKAEVKAPEAKPAAAAPVVAPEMKKEAAKPAEKKAKKTKKAAKPVEAKPAAAAPEAVKAAEPAKKYWRQLKADSAGPPKTSLTRGADMAPFFVHEKGRPQPPLSIALVVLLDLAQHVINRAFDFGVRQICCAAFGWHGTLAADYTLVKRFFAGRNTWRPGCLVINFGSASGAGVVASAANGVVNGCAIFRACSSSGCCFGQFKLGNWLDAQVGLVATGAAAIGSRFVIAVS